MPFQIIYSRKAHNHCRELTARHRSLVFDRVLEQLTHQPTVQTRNRKQMEPNPIAPWELRIGNLRVYYAVEEEPEQIVYIRAVGVKVRNRVRIGDEEVSFP